MLDNLNESEIEKLKQISAIYVQAKALICYAEQIDPDSKSNIQVIKELRDAFDHIIRVIHRKLLPENENKGVLAEDYFQRNLEKVIGHVYRAAFDALDGIVLSITYKVNGELWHIPGHLIKEVYTNYYNVKNKIHELAENVARHRQEKDIIQAYDNYVEDVEKLKQDYKEMLYATPSIIERFEEYKKSKRRRIYTEIIIGVSLVVLTFFLTKYFD